MRAVLIWGLLLLSSSLLHAQNLSFKDNAVRPPEAVMQHLRHYIEVQDGTPMGPIGKQYPYLPVYRVLAPQGKGFGDGVYCFIQGVHSSGQLFIYRKGKVTVLRNESTLALLTDYTIYLKQDPLPETTQLAYLTAVTAFAKYYYQSQEELVKAGALHRLK